jgi:peptidoglycan/xylan/chitin deacetylase (PgdA/CDA1 family)
MILGLVFGIPGGLLGLLFILAILAACFFTYHRCHKRRHGLDHVALSENPRIIALTIECYPDPETTSKILDLLKAHEAKATFFVTGGAEIRGQQEILQRIHDESHELGIHPFQFDGVETAEELNLAELEKYIREVEKLLPANPGGAKYLRPTGVIGSRKSIKARKLIKELDYKLVRVEILETVLPSTITPGTIIPIVSREEETLRSAEEVLNRMTAEKWKVVTVGALFLVTREQTEQTLIDKVIRTWNRTWNRL